MIQIKSFTAVHAKTRMKREFRHASHVRKDNDAILVRCELSTGHVGWGEGLPRDYVTGETFEASWQIVTQTLESAATQQLFRDARFDALENAVELLRNWSPAIASLATAASLESSSDARPAGFGNAARCPIELAILDAVGKATATPLDQLGALLPECTDVETTNDVVRYGLVVAPKSVQGALKWGLLARAVGFPDVKVKLGMEGVDDRTVLTWLRRVVGKDVPIRGDCNEAWTPAEVESRVKALCRSDIAPPPIESLEQPCPHEQVADLALLSGRIPPVVLDESLCCLTDAEAAVRGGYGEVFNLRVSKCGGLIPSFLLAAFAAKNNREYQVGCQVGETGILTAAGRALVCGLKNVRRREGSYDRYLMHDTLTKEDLTFGRGGRAGRLTTGGLGIAVDETAVQRITIQKHELLF